MYFLKQLMATLSTVTLNWEVWDLPWILLHHYFFFSYQSGRLFQIHFQILPLLLILLPLLWLKPPLFLACLEQQPYNLKICTRCCQCPAVSLDTHYSQICHRLVKASTCISLPEDFFWPLEIAKIVSWPEREFWGVNTPRSNSQPLVDGNWWIDTLIGNQCVFYMVSQRSPVD